ncbi:hypothetical protein ABET36_15915 [Caldifermentibacillus hisashii]|uniref:hypothetical protein n=1 Tax=Caldifermentibacillus hisashii TaxID=996558 RepID=UPI003D1C44F5
MMECKYERFDSSIKVKMAEVSNAPIIHEGVMEYKDVVPTSSVLEVHIHLSKTSKTRRNQ